MEDKKKRWLENKRIIKELVLVGSPLGLWHLETCRMEVKINMEIGNPT